jgi:hypothetical protein
MTGSTRGTGNDPLDGVDPGGTRPTSAARRGKQPVKTEEHVQSADRNTLNEGKGAVDDKEARERNPERGA